MLSPRYHTAPPSGQSGVTLVITLIVLVAMTLATIALMRSVDTSNIIAGNLAFQQAAAHAADAGSEDAIINLLPTVVATQKLACTTTCPPGYISWRNPGIEPPNPGMNWEKWWNAIAVGTILNPSVTTPVTLPQDSAGNTVSYVVESVCDATGQTGECAKSPPSMSAGCSGSNLGTSGQQCIATIRRYFRVTTRVQGPRNSVSYIQTMLAM